MSDTPITHSREDIWARIDGQSKSIAEIQAGQAAAAARLDNLENAVTQGLNSLATEIHSLAERVNAPEPAPNYVALFVGFVTVLGLFGSFALLIAAPIQNQVDDLKLDVAHLEEFDREANYIHGQRYALEQRVEDIDTQGSRRWINRDE